MIHIVDSKGRKPEEEVKDILRRVKDVLESKSGRAMQTAVKSTV